MCDDVIKVKLEVKAE